MRSVKVEPRSPTQFKYHQQVVLPEQRQELEPSPFRTIQLSELLGPGNFQVRSPLAQP